MSSTCTETDGQEVDGCTQSTSTKSTQKAKKRKRNDDKENCANDQVLQTAIAFLNKNAESDEWSGFGEFVASTLRKMK